MEAIINSFYKQLKYWYKHTRQGLSYFSPFLLILIQDTVASFKWH